MNKLKVGLLILVVLLFGGAMAQTQVGEPQPAALPALQTLVLPAGVELSDEELAKVEGQWRLLYYTLGGAGLGMAEQAASCHNRCSAGEAAVKIAVGGLAGAMTGFKAEVIQSFATVGKFALHMYNGLQGILLQEAINRYR